MKRILSLILAAAFILLPAAGALAEAKPSPKSEVVYGILKENGEAAQVYIVNGFRAGKIADYGSYSEVKNLSDGGELLVDGDMVTAGEKAGNFFYQGTPVDKNLPWDIAIDYRLDGEAAPPEKLGGASGALEILISVDRNSAVNPVFFENYMVQVSLSLDLDKCEDIVSENAAMALAGGKQVITHTIMPGEGARFSVSAAVHDFSMDSIEIAAVPMSSFIKMPDTGGIIKDMAGLGGAAAEIDGGAKALSEGSAQISGGAEKLGGAAAQIGAALDGAGAAAGELLAASSQIRAALGEIAFMFSEDNKDFDPRLFAALPGEVSAMLMQLKGGLGALSNNYEEFHRGLSEYAEGAKGIAKGYKEVQAGIEALAGGAGELGRGAGSLAAGTGKLREATAGLPAEVRAKINDLVEKYDKSDFKPVSFASEKNTEISSVQFVMKTAAIKAAQKPQAKEEPPAKTSFWQKLIGLFGFKR